MAAGIPRERLSERVRAALAEGDVVLTAGAGFGKTTLLEQALAGSPTPVAWISCSEADRDPGLLLMRIVRALAMAAPGTTDAIAERVAATPEQVDAPAVSAELTSELRRLLVEPVVLVIDDAERLDDEPAALELLAALQRGDAPLLRIALSTRRALALPLARRRAEGRLAELGAGDLAFDPADCAELLRSRGREGPTGERVDELMEATQGWPLGVALAAGDGAPRGGLASAPALRAYLAEELLTGLEPELRDAVLRSSAAERVTPAVARALGLPDDLGARAERAGLLLRRSASDGSWAYHPLLREFMAERLREELDEHALRELSGGLARAAEEEGDPVAAIRHWLDAGRWDDAAGAIEREGLTLVRSSPGMLRAWIAALPAELRERPALRALEGQSWWLDGDNTEALRALREAVPRFDGGEQAPAEWIARSILVDLLFAVGEPEGVPAAIGGWDGPDAAGAYALAPAAAVFAATVLASYGRFDESERLAEAALGHPESALVRPIDALRRLFLDAPAGDLDAACARLERATREMERLDPLNRRQHLLGALALALAERGDREAALALWHSIREWSRISSPVLADATHAWCALLHAQAGRLEEAERELAQHRRLEAGTRSYVGDLAPAAAASLRGDAAATEAAASAALLTAERAATLLRYMLGADLVPALANVGRIERAQELLRATLGQVDETYPGEAGRLMRGRLLALEAWLCHLRGDAAGADDRLVAAGEAAGDAARHVLRREWDRLEPVVWDALERDRIDPAVALASLEAAFPGGLELVPFLDHSVPTVRGAAIGPAVRSGDPGALARLERLATDDDPELASAASHAQATLARTLPPLRFEVLGRFAVTRGSWRAADSDWQRPIDGRLVRFLLTRAGQPVAEDLIFEALWPGAEPKGARRSLQVAASRARKLLDLPGAEGSLIEASEQSYRLALGERDTIDAEEFQAAAAGALGAEGGERLALLQRARSLWHGEPLVEERYSDWAASWREGLSDLHVRVLTAVVELHERSGDHVAEAGAARELVDLDPLNEGAHRALMTAYARAGRTGHALRQYLECRRTLVDELGIEPSEATSRLQARILAGEAV